MRDFSQYGNRRDDQWEILPWIPDPRPPFKIWVKPEQIAQCIEETHMGFMFAPLHHAAMKYAAPVRKELGIRTIFNILGPLTNPAKDARDLLDFAEFFPPPPPGM